MNLKPTLAALALSIALALPAGSARAGGPELNLPDFSHLRSKAIDSTDITIDGFLMRIAKHFAEKAETDGDPEAEQGLALLRDIKSVRVRNFTFDSDEAYSSADIEKVRKQLLSPEWSALVQVHKRERRENVDIYVCMENDKVTGLAVIASEPREFTIVNIIGSIDLDKIAQLEGQFGIPRTSQNP